MATKYARKLDPATGDVVFDDARRTWAAGDPDQEIIVRCLRTAKSTAARDRTYGLDLDSIDAGAPNAPALVAQRITAALSRWTTRGDFLVDAVEVERAGEAFFARVTHRRAGTKRSDATTTETTLRR